MYNIVIISTLFLFIGIIIGCFINKTYIDKDEIKKESFIKYKDEATKCVKCKKREAKNYGSYSSYCGLCACDKAYGM